MISWGYVLRWWLVSVLTYKIATGIILDDPLNLLASAVGAGIAALAIYHVVAHETRCLARIFSTPDRKVGSSFREETIVVAVASAFVVGLLICAVPFGFDHSFAKSMASDMTYGEGKVALAAWAIFASPVLLACGLSGYRLSATLSMVNQAVAQQDREPRA